MNGEAVAAGSEYTGMSRQQLTEVLVQASKKPEVIKNSDAFLEAWKNAPVKTPETSGAIQQPPATPAAPAGQLEYTTDHRLVFTEREDHIQKAKNPICRDFPRSDLGNSERFIERFGMRIRYCHPFKSWFVYERGRWARDERGAVQEYGKETVRYLADEAPLVDFGSEQASLFKWGGTSQAHPRISGMLLLAKSSLSVVPDELDADPDLLNFPNVTVNLTTMEARVHNIKDMISKIAGCNYDPAASCPLWERFLDRIMGGNKDLIGYLQRAAGYSLTGHTGERAIFLCHGRGANGKSTFLNALLSVVGDYGISVESNTFCISRGEKIRNDLAALKGTRLVTATEAGKGKRLDEAIIKQLTGGEDRIRARFLFQEYFEFKPECKIFWSFNSAPRITDSTDSIWDRVKMIPFLIVIPEAERDIRLLGKLLKEAPGIMNWMLAGLKEYQRIGLAEPEEVRTATRNYREEQDILADFFTEMCIIESTATGGATDLYDAYVQWHSWQAPEEKVKSQRSFGFEMADHGFMRDRDPATKRKIYLGIRLKKGGF
jgi:putative DNA primase/helicase